MGLNASVSLRICPKALRKSWSWFCNRYAIHHLCLVWTASTQIISEVVTTSCKLTLFGGFYICVCVSEIFPLSGVQQWPIGPFVLLLNPLRLAGPCVVLVRKGNICSAGIWPQCCPRSFLLQSWQLTGGWLYVIRSFFLGGGGWYVHMTGHLGRTCSRRMIGFGTGCRHWTDPAAPMPSVTLWHSASVLDFNI